MCDVTVVVLFYHHSALKCVQLIRLLDWLSVGLFYFPYYPEVLTNMLNLNKVYFVLLSFGMYHFSDAQKVLYVLMNEGMISFARDHPFITMWLDRHTNIYTMWLNTNFFFSTPACA